MGHVPTLQWVTRDVDVQRAEAVPYRLLEPVAELSVGDPASGNMLIQGDNLDALKALLPYYAGRVKCIYIDPPYNTRSAFDHYDDNLEHAKWIAMIYPRLALLRELMSEDGSIWISIDDNEAHYLKVIMDEIFGRSNFVASIVWQRTLTRRNDATDISTAHDYLLLYAKRREALNIARLDAGDRQRATYTNRDGDRRGDWLAVPFHAPNVRPNLTYPIITPGGRTLMPPTGRCWSTTEERYAALLADDRIYFGKDGNGMAQRKKFWDESAQKIVAWTWWPYDEAGDNREATREAKELIDPETPEPIFSGPKPEKLLARVVQLSTNPGDLVLDSFLGSGTTAAVAHKMGRRWIGIEMGEHAATHCVPRLRKVINGEQGGISAAVGWTGGGGFTFHRLGETVFDEAGALRPGIPFRFLASHIWFSEAGSARVGETVGPFLGDDGKRGVALLYNGVLGDKRPDGGNVLTSTTLRIVREAAGGFAGPLTVYGEASRLGPERLRAERVTFKQTPYDVRTR